jgi:hypothetical protein
MVQIPLTPEQYAAAGQALQQRQGIALTGTEGTLSKSGVTASYRYADGMLSIDILKKPFFLSMDYCEEQLKGFLATRFPSAGS